MEGPIDSDPTPLPPALSSPAPRALSAGRCARCGGVVDVRARHLSIAGSAVRVFCSRACAEAPVELPPAEPLLPAAPPRSRWVRHAARFAATLPILVFASGHSLPDRTPTLAPAAVGQVATAANATTAPEVPPFGPAWPPSEDDWTREIAADGWMHPLDGPTRRMPIRDSRIFGAERPGDRPGECRGGHCGVDLGGEVWGEPIHAAHDGVVERVQRGPNDEHGGLYVSIAHRNGTIYTKYFHLAAIPRWIQPGVKVKMGEVIGLLGDSGVKHSRPHLHFAVSVKPAAQLPEQYIDPEPLIALWPLRMPQGDAVMVATSAAPGVPLGAAGRHRHHAAAGAAGDDEAAQSE